MLLEKEVICQGEGCKLEGKPISYQNFIKHANGC